MSDIEAKFLFLKGLKALESDNMPAALNFFERASAAEPSPLVNSYLAFCIAKERGQIRRAITLCQEAIEKEPDNTEIYLNLGRIHIIAKNKAEAIKVFREGLGKGQSQKIVEELNRLGSRRRPVLPFLSRKNPLNKYLGLLLSKLSRVKS